MEIAIWIIAVCEIIRALQNMMQLTQELYDLYNKPKFVTHTTMQFQEFRIKRIINPDNYMADIEGIIERAKQALAQKLSGDLFEDIKENIIYEVDDKDMPPTITASIFVGRKE